MQTSSLLKVAVLLLGIGDNLNVCDMDSGALTSAEYSEPSYLRSMTTAVTDFIRLVSWTDVVLVSDSSMSTKQLSLLTTELAIHQVGTIVLQVDAENDEVISSVVSSMSTTFIRNVVICAKPGTVQRLFGRARQRDLLHSDHEWLIVGDGLPVTALQSILHTTSNVVLLSPKILESEVFQANSSSFQPNDSLGFEDASSKNTSGHLGPENITAEYVLSTFENISNNSFVDVGFWTPASGMSLTRNVYPNVFRHFRNATLRVSVWEAAPFLKRVPSEAGLTYKGFCIDLLNEIARLLNFTYQLFEPPDGQYGAPVGNGSWNGMVSMLIKGEVDIAVGPFTITPERKSVIDFTAPFMEDGGGILTKGGDQGVDMMNVFRPFPLQVWLMTGAAIFVTAIILYVITRVGYPRRYFQDNRSRGNNDRSRENNDNSDDNEPLTLADCLLVIFGSLMSQGAHRHPKASAGRLVLGFWWLFTILIVSIYTASFTAILTVTVNADTIDSIDDLAASDLDPITVAGTNWHTMFLTSTSGVYGQVGERMSRAPTVHVNSDALPLVKRGTAAYILDVNQIRFLYNEDCRNLHMAKTIFNNNGLGFALPQHAQYKDAINQVILRLQEGGFLETWRERWWPTSPECGPQGPSVSSSVQLGVVSMAGILILYGLVMVLACLTLVLHITLKNPRVREVVQRYRSFTTRTPASVQQ